MDMDPSSEGRVPQSQTRPPEDRLVYLVPHDVGALAGSGEISLAQMWRILWEQKWLIIAITTMAAMVSVAYALLATEWYRSEIVLAPAADQTAPTLGGTLGGLAALAGIPAPGGSTSESIATLRSRELARAFIEDRGLVRVLFADQWDAGNDRWIDPDPETWPDIGDAIEYFQDEILGVQEDAMTGLVTLSIDWTDAAVASEWAASLVTRVNEKLRQRALRHAEANIDYLRAELDRTGVVSIQESIGQLLESELQKLMLARGNEEFAFKVIDAAYASDDQVYPQRAIIAIVGTTVGGVLSVLLAFALHALRTQRSSVHREPR
jgi:uncharacterized protein involved in exopolysaccharide biosynthesis